MKNLRGIYKSYSLKQRKIIAREIKKESQGYGNEYVEIPDAIANTLDRNGKSQILMKAFRNRRFLAQVYLNGDYVRISVNRTDYDPDNDCWKEGITWDDLQKIKADMGFGNFDAVEVFPRDDDIIYVTNMRHLWIMPDGHSLDFIWRKKSNEMGDDMMDAKFYERNIK